MDKKQAFMFILLKLPLVSTFVIIYVEVNQTQNGRLKVVIGYYSSVIYKTVERINETLYTDFSRAKMKLGFVG